MIAMQVTYKNGIDPVLLQMVFHQAQLGTFTAINKIPGVVYRE